MPGAHDLLTVPDTPAQKCGRHRHSGPGSGNGERRNRMRLDDHVDRPAHAADRELASAAEESDCRDPRRGVVGPGSERAGPQRVSVRLPPAFREVQVSPGRLDMPEELVPADLLT